MKSAAGTTGSTPWHEPGQRGTIDGAVLAGGVGMLAFSSPRAATRTIGRVCLNGVLLVNLAVIAGWVTAVPRLRSFLPGRADMKLVTCAAALAGAAALFSLEKRRGHGRLPVVSSGVVIALSLLSLAEYAVGREFRFLTFLSPDHVSNAETIHPGRMAPNTAIAFLALSAASLLLAFQARRFRAVVIGCLVLTGVSALLPITGYLYGVDHLRGLASHTPMALPTAITLGLLGIATLAAAADRDFVPVLIDDGPAGMMLRRLLPVAVLIPLMLGWLQLLGQRAQWYGTAFATAIFSIAVVAVIVALIVITASVLQNEDARRRAADEMMRGVALVQQEIVMAPRDAQELMDLIARRSRELTAADGAVVELAQGEAMVYHATDGAAAPFRGMEIPLAGSASGLTYRTGRALLCQDTEHDERVDLAACRRVGARSMLVVPLRHGEATAGVLKVFSSRRAAFGESQQRVLEMLAGVLAAVLTYSHEFEKRGAAIAEQAAEIIDLHTRFESFVDRSPAIAFMKDLHGNYLYGNAAFHRAIGDPERDVLGRTDEAWLPEATAAEVMRRDREVLASGDDSTTIDDLRVDGEARWWMVFRFRVSAGANAVLGGVAIDVTEQRRAEEVVRRLNVELEERVQARTEELQRANEQLESFSYSVSHDLRTPLRAIDGYSRMLQEDYEKSLDEEGRRLLGVIRANTARMGDLIRDLLEFSRFARRAVQPVETDVARLARAVARRLLASDGAGRAIDLSVHDGPPATVDPSMFEQAIANLLSNAIKYSRDRTPARIDFRGWRDDGWVVYRVEDNGVGFDPRYGDKLFGVFQRLHHADEFEGTGVGLAIVKRVVERHGGRVWAEGEVGKGARFFMALPAKGTES